MVDERNVDEASTQRAVTAALSNMWRSGSFQRRLDIDVEAYWTNKRDRSNNPLVRVGQKYYSQGDEDGITLEICSRLGLSGRAVEFGVGNRLENNSLILLFSGWSVGWVGDEDLAIRIPPSCTNLCFVKGWVTAENCVEYALAATDGAGLSAVDLLSISLDGNDLYILWALLKAGLRPSVIVVGYNGKFPPPIRWCVRYEADHRWEGSDYQGASLQYFVDVASGFGYRLVCCNVTGTSAYFVREADAKVFEDVPTAVGDLFVAADYSWFVERGHRLSPLTIESALRTGREPG